MATTLVEKNSIVRKHQPNELGVGEVGFIENSRDTSIIVTTLVEKNSILTKHPSNEQGFMGNFRDNSIHLLNGREFVVHVIALYDS